MWGPKGGGFLALPPFNPMHPLLTSGETPCHPLVSPGVGSFCFFCTCYVVGISEIFHYPCQHPFAFVCWVFVYLCVFCVCLCLPVSVFRCVSVCVCVCVCSFSCKLYHWIAEITGGAFVNVCVLGLLWCTPLHVSLGGMAVLEFQGWAVGDWMVTTDGTYLVSCKVCP